MSKIKFDKGKDRLALVPTAAIKAIGSIMTHGVDKYYEDSWKEVEAARWKDALMRHWCDYIDDPYSIDPDSGLPHLWHLAANAAILCGVEDAHIQKSLKDNAKPDTVKYYSENKVVYEHPINSEEDDEMNAIEYNRLVECLQYLKDIKNPVRHTDVERLENARYILEDLLEFKMFPDYKG